MNHSMAEEDPLMG